MGGQPHPGEASQPGGESRYRRASDAQSVPPSVRIELVVVDGPEGRTLRAIQAAAVMEALRWFAQYQPQRRQERT
ncbi:MAG: hypothetical protein L0Y54_09950 [Sporichthyaceae bacterium]|nr:hypothetical protein [Sporichthyaceae bacterium]